VRVSCLSQLCVCEYAHLTRCRYALALGVSTCVLAYVAPFLNVHHDEVTHRHKVRHTNLDLGW
jgi:hypothetical protein